MVNFIKIPKEPNKNNPLCEELVRLISLHRLDLIYSNTGEILSKLSCLDHPNTTSTVTIREVTEDVEIDACCASFHDIIKSAITKVN